MAKLGAMPDSRVSTLRCTGIHIRTSFYIHNRKYILMWTLNEDHGHGPFGILTWTYPKRPPTWISFAQRSTRSKILNQKQWNPFGTQEVWWITLGIESKSNLWISYLEKKIFIYWTFLILFKKWRKNLDLNQTMLKQLSNSFQCIYFKKIINKLYLK